MRRWIPGIAASRRSALVAVFAILSSLASSCTTPTSRIRLPRCVDEITVAGQHARGSQTTLILDHSYDLPFTQTEILIEGRDGSTEELVVTNSVPDVWRLVGGGVVAVIGAAFLTRYSVAVTDGEDPLSGGWFWALPAGVIAGGIGTTLVLTGWHPPSDTVVDYECPAPPSGDAPPTADGQSRP